MAPINLNHLSSNWKNLQATLNTSSPTPSLKPTSLHAESPPLLKRKRTPAANARAACSHASTSNGHDTSPPRKAHQSRKRPKMETPGAVGLSGERPHTKPLPRSLSMPSLRNKTQSKSSQEVIQPASVLHAHPDFPDVENEGVSEIALPGKYVALDCEMVGVGPEPDRDSALARVSLVNFHGHQIYDSYVQVPRKLQVTNYRTAVSGIEPRHLRKDVARPFEEVRNDVKILLGGRMLVGHAVKNDLDVLSLKHDPRCIRDTSKFSKFRALALNPGWTPGLKLLAEKLLGVDIQTGAHSSVEDARATMALYRHDKKDFEQEVRQKYGHVRPDTNSVREGGNDDDDAKKQNKTRRKKPSKK